MGGKRKLTFKILDSNCIVCTSHALNRDGYLRVLDRRGTAPGRPRMTMYHRYVWETEVGPVPDGYEVDHKCRNRACQNVAHMQILTVSEHKAKTNTERSDDNRAKVLKMLNSGVSDTGILSEMFGFPRATVNRWKRYWRKLND